MTLRRHAAVTRATRGTGGCPRTARSVCQGVPGQVPTVITGQQTDSRRPPQPTTLYTSLSTKRTGPGRAGIGRARRYRDLLQSSEDMHYAVAMQSRVHCSPPGVLAVGISAVIRAQRTCSQMAVVIRGPEATECVHFLQHALQLGPRYT